MDPKAYWVGLNTARLSAAAINKLLYRFGSAEFGLAGQRSGTECRRPPGQGAGKIIILRRNNDRKSFGMRCCPRHSTL